MEAVVHSLLTGLAHRCNIILVTTPQRNKFDTNYEVSNAPYGRPGRYSRAYDSHVRRIAKEVVNDSSTVVLSIGAAARAAMSIFRDNAIPVVIQSHGTGTMEALSYLKSPSLPGALRILKLALDTPGQIRYLRASDRIICVGDRVNDSLGKWPYRSLDSSKRMTIRNGVEQDIFSFRRERRLAARARFGIKADDRVLLFVGRIHRQKGWAQCLDYFQVISQNIPSWMLFAGDGPEMNLLRRAAGDIPNVKILGAQRRSEVPDLLSMSDLLMFPSRRVESGVAMVLLEAAANGLPIASSQELGSSVPIREEIRLAGDKDSDIDGILEVLGRSQQRDSYLPIQSTFSNMVDAYLAEFQRLVGLASP